MAEELKKTNHFQKWYKSNATKLAETRKVRYATDPIYRERVLAARAKHVLKVREAHPLPEQYTTTLISAANELGITIWKLRHWRDKNYFPEPYSHGKALWFTDNQLGLLDNLNDFLKDYPRLPSTAKEKLDDLVSLIYANW